jgi:RNA polymerase sigma-70 factor (ECF subfamily)
MWIFRLTRNLAIDFLRKRARERENTVPITTRDSDKEERELPLADSAELPEERVIDKELAEDITGCIDSLPEETGTLLTLRSIGGMTYAEIAETLGISEGTVKSRISRSRKKLLEMLLKHGTISNTDRLIKRI